MNTPTQEITLTRMIHAAPAQVYAAFTRAEGWCAWCCEKAEAEPPTLIRVALTQQGDDTCLAFSVAGFCAPQDWSGFSEFLDRVWGRALNNLKTVLDS